MMLIEVEYLESVILSLKADKEFTVENLKQVISQNIHVPATDLTLASNGALLEDGHCFSEYFSRENCRVMLFLRKGEQIRNNIEVDFGHGKVMYIAACMSWTVGELKQKLQKAIKGELFDKTKFLTFGRYIMEDDRTLEDYKLREGSRITVFSYITRESSKKANGKSSKNGVEPPYPKNSNNHDDHHCDDPAKEVMDRFPKFETYEDHDDGNNENSASFATPLPPTPSPPPILEPAKIDPVAAQPMPLIPQADSSQPTPAAESTSSWNSTAHTSDHNSQNSSPNVRNGSESSSVWPATMEPKTIVIPGGFRRQPKSPFNKQFSSGTAMPERGKVADKMDVTFSDGARKMTVELPISATVGDGLEAVKARISDSDKDKLRLFKGYVQMESHHPLNEYGVVHGSTVVFKKPGPVKNF